MVGTILYHVPEKSLRIYEQVYKNVIVSCSYHRKPTSIPGYAFMMRCQGTWIILSGTFLFEIHLMWLIDELGFFHVAVENAGLNTYSTLSIFVCLTNLSVSQSIYSWRTVCLWMMNLKATDYWQGGRDIGVQLQTGVSDFSLLYSVQTGSGTPQPPRLWLSGSLSLGVKWPGCEAGDSPPSNSEVENSEPVPPLPYTSSWLSA
jgi:hypothetical protein